MGAIASQITSITIVYSTVYSDADQRKHTASASLAFLWGIHRWPVSSPHKGPVRRKMFQIWWRHHEEIDHQFNKYSEFDINLSKHFSLLPFPCSSTENHRSLILWSSLHWCHMSIMTSQMTSNSTVCFTNKLTTKETLKLRVTVPL